MHPPTIDLEKLRAVLPEVAAAWVLELALELREVRPGEVVARVLRLGRKLAFGEIEIFDAQGELLAHATTTCTLL